MSAANPRPADHAAIPLRRDTTDVLELPALAPRGPGISRHSAFVENERGQAILA